MMAESQFAQLPNASSVSADSTNDGTEACEPLLASPSTIVPTDTAAQPLETDFPAHVDTSSFTIADTIHRQLPLESYSEQPLETDFGSQCSVASSSQSQVPSNLYQYKISYEMTPYSSTLSSLHPVCRICQNPSEKNNVLITPCRCDGSLKHIHGTCLRKWIETRTRHRKYEYPSQCELCGYQYRKRKFIKCTSWKLPRMNIRDKILHSIFIISLVLMIVCAIVTIQCLLTNASYTSNKYRLPNGGKTYLTFGELMALACGVVFFITFILAMTVEIKARHTIYEVIHRFIRVNTVWLIENYNKAYDTEHPNSTKQKVRKEVRLMMD